MSDPTALTVEEGDPIQIVNQDDIEMGVPFIVEVRNNPIRFAHNKPNADRGATLSAGQTHTLSNFRGQGIWVAAFNGPSEIRVRPAGADFKSQPTQEVSVLDGSITAEAPSNADSINSQTITGSGQFSSESVFSGSAVVVRADRSNSGTISVDGFPLAPGDAISLQVSDVDAISVSASQSGDQTHAIYEVA